MKKMLKGFTVIETVIILIIAIAVVIAAIAVGNALLRSHYTNELVNDIQAIAKGAKTWQIETRSNIYNLGTTLTQLCTSGAAGTGNLNILNERICGSANTGVSANPFSGNYTVSGAGITTSLPGYFYISATGVTAPEGKRAATILSQEYSAIASYNPALGGSVSYQIPASGV